MIEINHPLVLLLKPLSEVMMRKPFVVPVLREEAALAQLTLQTLTSGQAPN